jgi:hypothetical protein
MSAFAMTYSMTTGCEAVESLRAAVSIRYRYVDLHDLRIQGPYHAFSIIRPLLTLA